MSLVHISDVIEERRARTASATGTRLVGSVVRTSEALDALAHRWQGLERFSQGANLFQSLGWARSVFDFEASRGNSDFDPVIALVEDGQRLVGILPLERVRTGARSLLVPLGHAFVQISDALLAPGADPAKAVGQLLRSAVDAAPSDGISLLKVRAGSALARGMPKTHVKTGEAQGAPYVSLEHFADFPTYFSTIRAKTRKNLRNARNRLGREGKVEHRVITDPTEQLALIERTLEGRADRLKEQGLTSRAFRDGGFAAYCKSLVARGDLTVLAFSLQLDGRPLAEQWGFVHGGRYYAFVASRDFSNSEESPGKLHLRDIIEACAQRGLRGCDLGVPVMPYKLTFATETIKLRDYALPVTPRGWLVIQLWDVVTRPLLKRLVLALPAGARARLMAAFGHGNQGEAG